MSPFVEKPSSRSPWVPSGAASGLWECSGLGLGCRCLSHVAQLLPPNPTPTPLPNPFCLCFPGGCGGRTLKAWHPLLTLRGSSGRAGASRYLGKKTWPRKTFHEGLWGGYNDFPDQTQPAHVVGGGGAAGEGTQVATWDEALGDLTPHPPLQALNLTQVTPPLPFSPSNLSLSRSPTPLLPFHAPVTQRRLPGTLQPQRPEGLGPVDPQAH